MRLFISLSAALLLAALILTACNSTDGSGTQSSTAKQQPQQPTTPAKTTYSPVPIVTPGDGVRRVTTAELQDALDKGTAIVIDVRGDDQYKAGHVKGAVHIPEAEVASRSGELPRDKMIVTYCSWPAEHTSARAVQELKTKGIENAAALLGGFDAWKKAGLPVEGG